MTTLTEATFEELMAEVARRKAAKPLWNGLFERPTEPEDGPNWKPSGGIAPPIYTDPETGEQWQDYQAQGTPDKEYMFIASGAQNCGNKSESGKYLWNAEWTPAEFYNEWFEERGVERVRQYKGELREGADPSRWPEPYRSAWFENH